MTSFPNFLAGPVTVTVPATSANLGPGYDALGLALSLRDRVTATLVDGPGPEIVVVGEGEGEAPSVGVAVGDGVGAGEGDVHVELLPPVGLVPGPDLPIFRRDDLGAGTRLVERLARLGQLHLLEPLAHEDRDPLAVELLRHMLSPC